MGGAWITAGRAGCIKARFGTQGAEVGFMSVARGWGSGGGVWVQWKGFEAWRRVTAQGAGLGRSWWGWV